MIEAINGGDQYGYSTLPEDSYQYHIGLLEYLSLAYASHNNPVFTPDMVYYAIMCEVAGVIKEAPETYRSLFTTSDKKEKILVPIEERRNGVPVLNMREFSGELSARIPGGIEAYLFPFSTTGEEEAFALQASFMDAVSPYYSYSMFMCGFPEVVLEGTQGDWFKILGACNSLQARLGALDSEVGTWLGKVGGVVTNFLSAFDDADTEWDKMFWSEACGSGSENFVRGWILDLYRKHPEQMLLEPLRDRKVPVLRYWNL